VGLIIWIAFGGAAAIVLVGLVRALVPERNQLPSSTSLSRPRVQRRGRDGFWIDHSLDIGTPVRYRYYDDGRWVEQTYVVDNNGPVFVYTGQEPTDVELLRWEHDAPIDLRTTSGGAERPDKSGLSIDQTVIPAEMNDATTPAAQPSAVMAEAPDPVATAQPAMAEMDTRSAGSASSDPPAY
jgi:hypothetical protein